MASASSASSLRSRLATLAGIALGLSTLVTLTGASLARANRSRAAWPPEADTFYLPPSSALRVASLGHNELFADLIHARGNVYFGTQLHARVPTKWLANYLHAAIDLDPQFHRLYLAGAAMLIYNGQKISPEMVLAATSVLERGQKAFPFDWEFSFQLGFDYLFELPQDAGEDDPRVPGWRQLGVEKLRQAALYEEVPYFVPNLVARMLTKSGGDDLAIRHLEQAYAVATHPEVREQIRNKLVALRGQSISERLEEDRRGFDELMRGRYPEAPEAFSIIAGPRATAIGLLDRLPTAPPDTPPKP